MAALVFAFVAITLNDHVDASAIRPRTIDQITHFLALSAEACASA